MRPTCCILTLLAAALAPVPILAAEGRKIDPWEPPPVDCAELSIVITQSKRSYNLRLAGKVLETADAPERVEPPETAEELRALQACRDLQAAGKWPESESALRDLLGRSPALHDARSLLGTSLLRQQKPAEAAAAIRDSLIGNRRNPDAWKALEEAAAIQGMKVLRPSLKPRGWVAPLKGGEVEVGFADADVDADFPWNSYAMARAVYRYEGAYGRECPGKEYRFTLREQVFAASAAVRSAQDDQKEGKKVPPDLARLVAEAKAKTLVPFVFFALYPEPLPAEPERDFEVLRPRLQKYFDERILVRK